MQCRRFNDFIVINTQRYKIFLSRKRNLTHKDIKPLSLFLCSKIIAVQRITFKRFVLTHQLMLMPIDKLRSQRYLSKPSLLRFKETRETCALSIAWTWIPESEHSNVASVRRSFTASNTFFRSALCTRRASNIMLSLYRLLAKINSISTNTWRSFLKFLQIGRSNKCEEGLAVTSHNYPRFCYRCPRRK